MLFNIHHGQMRFRGGKMVYLPKSPKSALIMQDYEKGVPVKRKAQYRADKLGNIDIINPKHVEVMVGLGYPIYNGDGRIYPVPLDDLLFPNLNMDSEYYRRIQQALFSKRED